MNILEDLPAMTIAAVNGVCTGGGLELTLVCDFVIATEDSTWGMPEIDWEITPDWGGISRIGRFAGRRKSKEWNLLLALFDARSHLSSQVQPRSLRIRENWIRRAWKWAPTCVLLCLGMHARAPTQSAQFPALLTYLWVAERA